MILAENRDVIFPNGDFIYFIDRYFILLLPRWDELIENEVNVISLLEFSEILLEDPEHDHAILLLRDEQRCLVTETHIPYLLDNLWMQRWLDELRVFRIGSAACRIQGTIPTNISQRWNQREAIPTHATIAIVLFILIRFIWSCVSKIPKWTPYDESLIQRQSSAVMIPCTDGLELKIRLDLCRLSEILLVTMTELTLPGTPPRINR